MLQQTRLRRRSRQISITSCLNPRNINCFITFANEQTFLMLLLAAPSSGSGSHYGTYNGSGGGGSAGSGGSSFPPPPPAPPAPNQDRTSDYEEPDAYVSFVSCVRNICGRLVYARVRCNPFALPLSFTFAANFAKRLTPCSLWKVSLSTLLANQHDTLVSSRAM